VNNAMQVRKKLRLPNAPDNQLLAHKAMELATR
jgi:hypothetical protein